MRVVGGDEGGTVGVGDAALAQIVVQAAESVEGARVRRARRHLELEVEGRTVRVVLELAVAYGKVLPEVGRAVQERVADALRTMCGFEVAAVDVSIEELDR